jgi:hypothetical protein
LTHPHDIFDLEGKTAVVTGTSAGIGTRQKASFFEACVNQQARHVATREVRRDDRADRPD